MSEFKPYVGIAIMYNDDGFGYNQLMIEAINQHEAVGILIKTTQRNFPNYTVLKPSAYEITEEFLEKCGYVKKGTENG